MKTEYKQYSFDAVPIDLVNLYERENLLWKYYPNKDNTYDKAVNYLMLKHSIDYDIIQKLIQKNMLWQGRYYKTIEFPITTEKGDLVAVEAINYNNQGCYRSREVFGYGFTYQMGDTVNWLVFVKSAIELLSLYQLRKDALVKAGCLLISMCGTSPTIIARYKSLYPHAEWCVACYPNKHEKHTLDKYFAHIRWKLPTTPFKKWNDELIADVHNKYSNKK